MTKRALYPGSFDPVTAGHMDIIARAALIFDEVVVAVLVSGSKEPLFSLEERCALLREAIGEDPRITVEAFTGLTVECARKVGAQAIVRGLRAVSDFESEFSMALMNRRLAPDIHTVFLMTAFSNVFVSSSIVKEVCRHGGDISSLAPAPSVAALKKRFQSSASVAEQP